MPPRPPASRGTHPVVVAAAAVVVAAAAGIGVWMGSRTGIPEPVPVDPALATEPFLPARPAPEVASADVEHGEELFQRRCASCHTIGGGDGIGPDLALAALRRDPQWVLRMVEAPDSMFRTDSVARWILSVHDLQPADTTAANPDLKALAAFFKTFDRPR